MSDQPVKWHQRVTTFSVARILVIFGAIALALGSWCKLNYGVEKFHEVLGSNLDIMQLTLTAGITVLPFLVLILAAIWGILKIAKDD